MAFAESICLPLGRWIRIFQIQIISHITGWSGECEK